MLLIPQTPLPKAKTLAIQTETALEATLTQLANGLSGSIQECWKGDGYSPQEYIDSYEGKAASVFSFHGELIGLLRKHAAILPTSAQVPDSVLALVGTYKVNSNGTVTVQ